MKTGAAQLTIHHAPRAQREHGGMPQEPPPTL